MIIFKYHCSKLFFLPFIIAGRWGCPLNFNSWQFLVFFPLAAAGYFALTMGAGSRNEVRGSALARIFLLGVSLFFYGCWNPAYLGLILLSVALTWVSGLLMEGRSLRLKRLVLAASLVINLGILFFFKYYGFFSETAALLSGGGFRFPAFEALLPVGISFYTFQALGYSMDVYRGQARAERDFVSYALFVTFFPQLVAGPIERTGNLLPQFKINHGFDYDRVTSGLRLAAWGMFKKAAIADRLAVYVNGVYGDPAAYPAASLALAAFFFAFQIYCDFSGYSDIAIGCARVLGFNLMNNFRQPCFAASITDFWRRWHISLSTWLKDYLYIPLGGSRKGAARQRLNLLLTFLLSGLWHGAAWHFVAWGALHGLFQIIERSAAPVLSAKGNKPLGRWIGLPEKSPALKAVQVCLTFFLVCFAWIFFRAHSMGGALVIIAKLAELPSELAGYVRQLPAAGIVGTVRGAFQLGRDVANPIEGFGITALGLSGILIGILILSDIWTRKTPGAAWIMQKPLVLRWAGYYTLALTIFFSWGADPARFIYFTF
jgi:D-alanyl-lipoteichoic acid acyltransferase DltB (MBOAT superfamily)